MLDTKVATVDRASVRKRLIDLLAQEPKLLAALGNLGPDTTREDVKIKTFQMRRACGGGLAVIFFSP